MVRVVDRLTERARLAVLVARREAQTDGTAVVSTLHLLAGLIVEEEGLGADYLTHHGVRLEEVRDLARAHSGARFVSGQDGAPGELPLSPAAERSLQRATAEARWLGLEHAATEHLLLGLLHEGDGEAIRLLLDAGLSETAVRDDLVRRARRRR